MFLLLLAWLADQTRIWILMFDNEIRSSSTWMFDLFLDDIFLKQILLAKRVEDVLEHAFEGGCPWRQSSKL